MSELDVVSFESMGAGLKDSTEGFSKKLNRMHWGKGHDSKFKKRKSRQLRSTRKLSNK